MSKGLEELKRMAYENACCRCQYYINNKCANESECVWKTIEKELDELEETKKINEIFKNALTIEHKPLVIMPDDHSKNAISYFAQTIYEIKQNELDGNLKKALREWVLKNAFPKELKALEIIKEHIAFDRETNVLKANFQWYIRNKEEQDLLKEVLLNE